MVLEKVLSHGQRNDHFIPYIKVWIVGDGIKTVLWLFR